MQKLFAFFIGRNKMYLDYLFLSVENMEDAKEVGRRLKSGEFDFAYSESPIKNGQRLFRGKFPENLCFEFAKPVLLFRYVPEQGVEGFADDIAVQDIYAGLVERAILSEDECLWEWQECSRRAQAENEIEPIPIVYAYSGVGENSNIYYGVKESESEVARLVRVLENIVDICLASRNEAETKEEFAGRVEWAATKALLEQVHKGG
jgi:hypothetical protein